MPALHPNPPRLVTVSAAVALLVVGTILGWPVTPLVDLLQPLEPVLTPVGLGLTVETGYLALFAGNVLLVAGSLLPGI
jgi:hypothetical protein